MKVQTKTLTEQTNIRTAISICKMKSIKLDENKKYRIKVAVNESALASLPTLKKVNAKLVQQTDLNFVFEISTKSGDKRIEIISKFDYIKNPSLIEVIN